MKCQVADKYRLGVLAAKLGGVLSEGVEEVG